MHFAADDGGDQIAGQNEKKENIAQIAIRTGMPEAEVRMIFDRVDRYLQGNDELKDAALRKAIDGMDMIINKL